MSLFEEAYIRKRNEYIENRMIFNKVSNVFASSNENRALNRFLKSVDTVVANADEALALFDETEDKEPIYELIAQVLDSSSRLIKDSLNELLISSDLVDEERIQRCVTEVMVESIPIMCVTNQIYHYVKK